ncbi:MAG: NAD(P)/FAD-dependent oxidoreductase, partial [Pseudorhizobium sp.]
MTDWQSPIAPGLSWYQSTLGERPSYPALDGSRTVDVAIVGGGFTGLQAAYNLAKQGASVALLEAYRFGDGASGRNGGQFGTGQRAWPEEMEAKIGFERSKALFDMAEAAKRYLLDFAAEHDIDMEYTPGQMNVAHKPGYEKDYRANAEIAAARYNYPHLTFMDRAETAERLGSSHYHCGVRDTGTGHIHPLKLLIGLARAADAAGAELHEMTKVTGLSRAGGRTLVETEFGTVSADRVLLATNAYGEKLEPVTAAHIMPIGSFIAATEPLDDHPGILSGGEGVADSRFVVRYFRKTPDNRLLFGGREVYSSNNPEDTANFIRKQIVETYPDLKDVRIT